MVKETITKGQRLTATIPHEMAGQRLDQALATLFPQYSRARLQLWIRDGQVTVNSMQLRSRDRLQGGESVNINAMPEEITTWEGEPIPLDIVYEDEALFVINKPAGMVAHPGAGNHAGCDECTDVLHPVHAVWRGCGEHDGDEKLFYPLHYLL